MGERNRVLVLGAYGLAGRAIVETIRRTSQLVVIASGRLRGRLQQEFGARQDERLETVELDATDAEQLRRACESVDLVINAVGPFNRSGADIARTVIGCGRHYIDCANEQIHYERLRGLHQTARSAALLLVTGAGLIPGLSTLLAAHLLVQHSEAEAVDIVYAQLRPPFRDGGQASLMSGVLDAVYRPWSVRRGVRTPVTLGRSVRTTELPPPFGSRRLFEVPTLDVPILEARAHLREIHTWFHLGDQPGWMFGLIRLLNPAQRTWAYRIIDGIVGYLNRAEFDRAIKQGLDARVVLQLRTVGAGKERGATLYLTDGASPVGVLPARIVRDLASGKIEQRGLATPVDLYRWADVREDVQQCVLHMEVDGE
jgi:short subunit dehydrogenase-like uncharacterized protein